MKYKYTFKIKCRAEIIADDEYTALDIIEEELKSLGLDIDVLDCVEREELQRRVKNES